MAPSPLVSLIFLVFLVVSVVSASSSCQSFSSNICNDVIDSYWSGQVYGDLVVLEVTEIELESEAGNMTIIGPILAPDCFQLLKRFVCGNYFPECSSTNSSMSDID